MAGLDISENVCHKMGRLNSIEKVSLPFELRLATLPTSGGFESAALPDTGGSRRYEIRRYGA